ncbi:hypothetical protein SNE40_018639 [Patella caerulea]|uniref:Arginyl-tRNA--protein transferase 1 n=1 Tax=Patella caerulea TaxID=87958 RepID=A0AAN8J5J1_PATCE
METKPSIVEYYSEHGGYRCGYCNSSNTNYSHGMWAHALTVQDYQDLIDRGWRRSGKYCYKPTLNVTCCPQNTIKCAAMDFKMNKSHKKMIKQINKYLIHGTKRERNSGDHETDSGTSNDIYCDEFQQFPSKTPSDIKMVPEAPSTSSIDQLSSDQRANSKDTPTETSSTSSSISVAGKKNLTAEQKTKDQPQPGKGADPKLPPCKKAKQIRAEKKKEKLLKNTDQVHVQKKAKEPTEKTLEDFLNEPDKVENPAHKLEIKLVRSTPRSTEFDSSFKTSHQIYHKYQMSVHKDPPEKPTERQFTRFLCDSPLRSKKGDLPMGYGSFHQHYILDGKLIAVGVIDILPYCVSSVYLYYDPEYSFLSLGTYSALREMAFTRELNKYAPNLKYYYMGFYIHSCHKMRYKGQYTPSFLVCPETYAWVPIEKCRPKLDATKYCKLDDNNTEDKDSKIDINKVLVLRNGEAMTYEIYRFENPRVKDEDEVLEYAKLTGKTCAERMLLFRQ